MLNATHAHCSLANAFDQLSNFVDETGHVQTNLRLYSPRTDSFVDSASNGRLALLFYKCEVKANDCSQCLALNRQYSCMWCNANPIGYEIICQFVLANKHLSLFKIEKQ